MKNKYKKHGGFTLIEMIISFALFAIVMTPIYSMIISTMNHNKSGEVKQTASLQGQEIFEKIKSEDIVPVKDGNGNMIGIKIGGKVIQTSTNQVKQDLGNGYAATVKILKNSSINLDKTVTSIATSNFNVDLSSSNTSTTINVEVNNEKNGVLNYTALDDVVELVINTKTDGNKKLIVIKDKNNNVIKDNNGKELSPTYQLDVSDTEKNNQIKLIIDFDGYKVLSTTDRTKLRNVKVSVYNQDDVPLNICLQKQIDLNVIVDTKIGNVRVFDNRASNDFKLGELYNIDVGVTQTINGETKTIFTGKTSQNMNVN